MIKKPGIAVLLLAGIIACPQFGSASVQVLDLTPVGDTSLSGTAFVGGGFIVQSSIIQPTGAGIIEPFLRLQHNGEERGYNTSATPQLDAKPGPWTHALQLSDVPIVDIGGTDYREFLYDSDQIANGNISLNQIQLFQSATDVGTSFTLLEAGSDLDAVISFPSLTPVFQMNDRDRTGAGTSYEVWIDGGHGSGMGDMFLYVPNSVFAASPASYITLFTQFGTPPGTYDSNDGPGEWAVLDREGDGGGGVDEVVPEPSTIAVWSLLGLVGFAYRWRKKRNAA